MADTAYRRQSRSSMWSASWSTTALFSSTTFGLQVWMTVLWPTLSFGVSKVGVTADSAKALASWYAYKLRPVLDKPAHVTHLTTTDEDPVLKLHRPPCSFCWVVLDAAGPMSRRYVLIL